MSRYGLVIALIAAGSSLAGQPPVGSSPGEPHWKDLLAEQWKLDIDRDLRNPLFDDAEPAGLFVRVDASKPVTFKPLIALGMETTTHGGWYKPGGKVRELWTYAHKQPAGEIESGEFTAPTLGSGDVTFDPGDGPFGLHVSNDNFDDAGVFSEPGRTARENDRLKSQPYKAMIYPNCDPKTRRLIPDSYIIGWEYSTNDDFQDVVTRIDNVRLVPGAPAVPSVLKRGAKVEKIADGFKFTEGPAWDRWNGVLLFSDIPPENIVLYAHGRTSVVRDDSGGSNGLMFDKDAMLICCEHVTRQVTRGKFDTGFKPIATAYEGKRLNSPNDLWIDAEGGIYFTDPRYGNRDTMEMEIEGVYYIAPEGELSRLIDDLVRPNGIALSPDGKTLYVLDNGADLLYRYPVRSPGKIGKGEVFAKVTHPDGMSVDKEGRLYLTARGGVWVLDRDGKWLGIIETDRQPANCTFGGKDYRTLFITARDTLYKIDTQTRGWHVHLDGIPSR